MSSYLCGVTAEENIQRPEKIRRAEHGMSAASQYQLEVRLGTINTRERFDQSGDILRLYLREETFSDHSIPTKQHLYFSHMITVVVLNDLNVIDTVFYVVHYWM